MFHILYGIRQSNKTLFEILILLNILFQNIIRQCIYSIIIYEYVFENNRPEAPEKSINLAF